MRNEVNCNCIGNLSGGKWDRCNECNRRVYDINAISPTLTTCGGGNQEVKIAVPVCVGNVNPSGHGMNGNVFDADGISPTLTTNKGEGVKIKEPTALRMVRTEQGKALRKAYEAKEIQHGFNEFRKAEPREDGCSNTLSTVLKDNLIAEPVIGAIRGRNPENPSDRTPGIHTQQRLEIGGDVSNTLTTVQKDNVVVEQLPFRVRKLTPKECWRLMGFDDGSFERAEKVNSNSQLYKQAGNSIVVDVLMAIFKEMM